MLGLFYEYVRALSLDIVGGTVICTLFLGRLMGVTVPPEILAALGLAVWVIYTLDHLWDAYRLKGPAKSFRHRFHQTYFKPLSVLTIFALLTGLILLPDLPGPTLVLGLALTVLVGGYFWWLYVSGAKPSCWKEFMVSFVYALGIFTGPVSLSEGPLEGWLLIIFVQFALLAFVNLLEFSYFEQEIDQWHRFGSAVVAWGRKHTRRVVLGGLLAITLMSLGCLALWPENQLVFRSQMVLLSMTAVLGCIIFLPGYFGSKERFRVLGDGIFLLPSLFLIWPL